MRFDLFACSPGQALSYMRSDEAHAITLASFVDEEHVLSILLGAPAPRLGEDISNDFGVHHQLDPALVEALAVMDVEEVLPSLVETLGIAPAPMPPFLMGQKLPQEVVESFEWDQGWGRALRALQALANTAVEQKQEVWYRLW